MDKFNMQTQNEFIDFTAPLCQRLQLISRAHLLDLPGMMCLELIDNASNPSLPVCHIVLARSFFLPENSDPDQGTKRKILPPPNHQWMADNPTQASWPSKHFFTEIFFTINESRPKIWQRTWKPRVNHMNLTRNHIKQ